MQPLKSFFQSLSIGFACRETLRRGYKLSDLFYDVGSGITICILAIPMTMAVAIACGVDPEYGLYGSLIASPIIALLGGAQLSVTGPVAELAVLIYPVVYQYGLSGLMIVTWMAGMMLLVMGLSKLGRVIEFIPYPVTTGFIAGTGVVICLLQVKDFFGLDILVQPKYFIDRVVGIYEAIPSIKWGDTLVGIATLLTIIVWPRTKFKIPGHLVGIIVGSLLAYYLTEYFPDIHTIGSRYGGIPQSMPQWLPIPQPLDFELIRGLFSSAFAIAMLCSIKALLCAVVVDGMKGTKHKPNAELIAHGIANLVVPFFGGLTVTSALSRSVANVRVGARSPLSSLIHGLSILIVILLFAPWLSYMPMAGLAALLLIAAWNIFDYRHCLQIIRIGTRSDIMVLLICFGLTVLVDMVIAVGVGMVLAALLFMKRMANITGGRWLLEAGQDERLQRLPENVMVYEISGPLFFGAAEKAMSTLREHSVGLKVVILQMHRVPTMDISGLVALKSALGYLQEENIFAVLCDIQPQPQDTLYRAGIKPEVGKLAICSSLDDSIAFVNGINLLGL